MMPKHITIAICIALSSVALTALPTAAQASSKDIIIKAKQFQKSRNVAVVVGIEAYDVANSGVGKLNYSVDDAVKLATVLGQNRYSVKRLVDAQAGKHQILHAIRNMGKTMDKEGTFVFSFSGHGFAENGVNYLVVNGTTTSDLARSALKLDDVIAEVKKTGARKAVLFIDACRNTPGSKDVAGRSFVPQNGRGMQVLLSTEFGTKSWETPVLGQGVFSHFLARGLSGEASDDSIVDFNELALYVEANVRNWTAQHLNQIQQPKRLIKGETHGQFVLSAKGQLPALNDAVVRRSRRPPVRQPVQPVRRPQQPVNHYHAQVRHSHLLPRGGNHQHKNGPWNTIRPTGRVAAVQPQRQPVVRRQPVVAVQPVRPRPVSRQSFEPVMVRIPAGTFRMGCLSNDSDCDDSEKPVRQVSVNAFNIGKYEVTFAQWDACVADGGCSHIPSDEGWGRGNRPVINVSWNDTQQYIAWLKRKTGKNYRLPTEAEWEYAARAGTQTKYPWGNGIDCSKADYLSDGKSCHGRGTSPVTSFSANRWGLYNTVGNIWELVADRWNESYNGAPTDAVEWLNGVNTFSVIRGGSLDNIPRSLRSSARSFHLVHHRYYSIGFRLAQGL